MVSLALLNTEASVDQDSDQLQAWNEWIRNGQITISSTVFSF